MDLNLKSFDWHKVKKLADPKSADDLNAFLEKLPQNAGQPVLIAAAIAWAMAGALGLYTAVQVQTLTELRNEMKEAEALVPVVPNIRNVGVGKSEVETFVDKADGIYKGLKIQSNGSNVIITSGRTSNFGEFREAIGHVQNGGEGWRVTLDKLCVGRECDKQHKLAASLNVNKVSVENPSN